MEEMKISELSIGDWVKIDGVPKRVHSIEYQNGEYFVHFSDPDINSEDYMHAPFIKPIPLTPEILEKNGFKNKGEYERKRERIGIFRMTTGALIKENERRYLVQFWHSHKRQVLGVTDTVSISDRTWGDSCSLNKHNKQRIYVHQLQHALRLAGVEKEIEL